ncbi:MAG TPA: hypothetical protein VK154_18030 [Chitinophagales bacterium]|nr:hypothetical protein [Chitinophagales bacterium]
MTKHLIDKVLITLEVGDKTALLVLLAKDGSVHRKGNGNPDSPSPLAQGISHDGHFEALMMTINEDIFNYAGVIKQPNPMGRECRLSIIFQGQGDLDYSFRVVYGENSEGPPQELAQILINAVKITESWYMQQLQPQADDKKWWQVWK